MSRLTPVDYKTLARVFESFGFVLERERSSHLIYEKPGVLRPVIIPKYSEVGADIIHNNLRTAGISRQQYLDALRRV